MYSTPKLNLFLQQTTITQDVALLMQKIMQHLQEHDLNYVLFRHSALYFFNASSISFIEKTKDRYKSSDYLRFDGQRLTRLNSDYYLGLARNSLEKPEQERSFGDNSNNNNNNNNNNGNNGNNG